jgi:hypothetical protein
MLLQGNALGNDHHSARRMPNAEAEAMPNAGMLLEPIRPSLLHSNFLVISVPYLRNSCANY